MKSRLFIFVLLTTLLSFTIVSATVTFTITPAEVTLSKTTTSATFDINNTGSEKAIFTIPTVTVSGVSITLSELTGLEVDTGTTKTITATVNAADLSDLLGDFERTITITSKNAAGNESSSADMKFKLEGGDYCKVGNIGDLEIDRIKFDNQGIGDDDEWYLTDEIEVKIRVDNLNNDDDMDDVIVEWGIFNTKTGKFIIDEEEDEFDIDDGEDEEITFKIKLDPDEFDEDDGDNDFVFLAKAFSDDFGEELHCNEKKENIKVPRDKNFVVLDDIEFTNNVPCGTNLDVAARIWNIGDNDEEDIYIIVTNTALGINERVEVGDLDILDSKRLNFNIKVPDVADEKIHVLKFEVYDEDEDIFENENNDESSFEKLLTIEGQCEDIKSSGGQNVLITAELDPETPVATAGKQVVVKATLRNTGDSDTTYIVSIFGNSAWSTLSAIDPSVVTLTPEESKEVSIFLNIDEDAAGEQEFTIKANYGEKSTEQRVALTVGEGVNQDFVIEHLRENWFIYVIVIVNIILIIAIISVIRRIAGKPAM